MTDKVLKLLNSDSNEDVYLGISLLIQDPNFRKYFSKTFEEPGIEKNTFWVGDEFKFRKIPFSVAGIVYDEFIIYRVSYNLVYAEKSSSYYRSVLKKQGILDNRTIKT